MLKKISFFALAALVFVGCNSKEENKENKRNFKDSAYAFINSQPNVVGYGRLDLGAIMDEGNIEQVGIFQLFAAETYEGLKKQIDLNTPVYIAATTTEGHSDLTVYSMFKLKDEKSLTKFWTESGYEFEKHKGVSYTEDEGMIIAAKDNVAMLIMIPGDFNAKKVVSKAYASAEGKVASGEMKKRLEAKGDFVMHMSADELKANDRSFAMVPNGTELDFKMNFEKGEMVFESQLNQFDKLKGLLGVEKSDAPIVAKKATDENGNLVMAMQLSVSNPMMDELGMSSEEMEKAMNLAPLMLEEEEVSLNISDLEEGDQVLMPSGKVMGDEFLEVVIDLDAMLAMAPEYKEYEEYWSKLDSAALSVMQDGTMRLVVTTDEKGQNFLATVFKAVDDFMSNGGLMQLMAAG
jgi:hypothetical protein